MINMRADVVGPPPLSLNDADLEAHARDVAQFLGIDPDQLATQALQAASNQDAATLSCRRFKKPQPFVANL